MAEGVGDKVKYRTLPMSVYDTLERERERETAVCASRDGVSRGTWRRGLFSRSPRYRGLPTGLSLYYLFNIRRFNRSIEPIPPPLPGYRSDEDEALRVVESKRRGGRQGVTVYGPISDCVEPVVLGGRNRG